MNRQNSSGRDLPKEILLGLLPEWPSLLPVSVLSNALVWIQNTSFGILFWVYSDRTLLYISLFSIVYTSPNFTYSIHSNANIARNNIFASFFALFLLSTLYMSRALHTMLLLQSLLRAASNGMQGMHSPSVSLTSYTHISSSAPLSSCPKLRVSGWGNYY